MIQSAELVKIVDRVMALTAFGVWTAFGAWTAFGVWGAFGAWGAFNRVSSETGNGRTKVMYKRISTSNMMHKNKKRRRWFESTFRYIKRSMV